MLADDGQLAPNQALDVAHASALAAITKRQRHTASARAPRPPDAMHVALRVFRNVEVHDVTHAVDIDPARRHIGRDQHLHASILEGLERPLPGVLRLVAMDDRRFDPGMPKPFDNTIGTVLGSRENENARRRWL